MIQMMLMILVGWLLRKVKLLDAGFTGKLTTLLLNVTVPCMILASVMTQTSERNLGEAALVFGFGLVLYTLLPLFSLLLVKLLRFPLEQQGVYTFMMAYSNVGFMGFPLINALYGSDALFYTAIINVIFTISTYTIGLALMHHGSGRKATIRPKTFLTPGVLLSLFAMVLYLLDLRFPDPLVSAVDSIGDLTTPLAMFCIGSTLASMSPKNIFNDWRVYLFSVVKQVLLPLLLLPVLRLVISSDYLRGILYVLILTPVANSSVLFATQYGFDEKLAAKGVFITTILSMVTIPLLGTLL